MRLDISALLRRAVLRQEQRVELIHLIRQLSGDLLLKLGIGLIPFVSVATNLVGGSFFDS